MPDWSAICLFCEDIREEKSGQDSIVGILPDNMAIAGPPPPSATATAILPKLAFYIRVNFKADGDKPKEMSARIQTNAGAVIAATGWATDVIDKAFKDANANQLEFAGLLLKAIAGPVPIGAGGRLQATLTIDGADHLIGVLNVILPTASEQPASQSPPAA